MVKNNLTVSVIIPTRNRAEHVAKCLDSILLQTKIPEEVIIVDASKDKETKKVASKYKNIKLKYIHTNIPGGGYQRNLGVENSSGRIVLFTDDDTIWEKECLEEMLRIFKESKNVVGGVSGKAVRIKTGRKINLREIFNNLFSIIFFLSRDGGGKFLPSGMVTVFGDKINKIKRGDFLFGYCMAFERKVFDEFPLDTHFKGYVYSEDDDLACRISKKYPIYYTPFARMIHTMPRKETKNNYPRNKKMIVQHYYFFKKNMPNKFINNLTFSMAMTGLLIKSLLLSIRKNNYTGVKGVYSGIRQIRRRK